jgi:hypothetical protein
MRDSKNRTRLSILILGAATLVAAPVRGQNLDLAFHLGTMGLGADLSLPVGRDVGLRASLNYIPFDINIDEDSIEYTLELPTPQVLLLADFYPIGRFRLSGGIMISTRDIKGRGELAEPIEIGNTVYTPAEVGTVSATIRTRSVSPYIGIGFGNPTGSRLAFFMDLGVAFHGNPELSAEANGPVSSLPGFQQDLDIEVRDIQDDIDGVVVYPVLSLGISIGLGAR